MKTAEEYYKQKYEVDIPNQKGIDMIRFAEEYASQKQPEVSEEGIKRMAFDTYSGTSLYDDGKREGFIEGAKSIMKLLNQKR